MKPKTLKWTVGIVVALFLIAGVFLIVMQSVLDSPALSFCYNSYGYADNQYNYQSGTVFGYAMDLNSVFYGSSRYSWSLGDPRPVAGCGCGSLSLPDGTSKRFGNTNTATSYWCGCTAGDWNYPLAFKDGKLVAHGTIESNKGTSVSDQTALEGAELVVDSCYFMYGTMGRCNFRVNIPKDKVGLTFDNDKLMTFVGNDLTVPLYLQNNWTYDLNGRVVIEYLVETPFGNATKEVVFDDFTLPVGGKEVNVTVPTENVAEFLYFRAKFSSYLKNGVHYTGIPNSCNYNAGIMPTIAVNEFDTGWQRVVVNPKPLYLPVPAQGSCVSLGGYEMNKDKTFCIRSDIKGLGCMQIGCPVFENLTNEYFCTSAGICAEMVYKNGCRNDSDCEDFGAVCEQSAFEEKYCVKTEIREIIKDIPYPVYVHATCDDMNFMCAKDYECVDWEVNGTKMATCQKVTIVSSIPAWVWYVVVGLVCVLIFVVIVSFTKGKKRGRRK